MPNENPPIRRDIPTPLTGGPIRFGPYWLEARLAVGGTAEVYIARPIDPRVEPQRLVIKRLLPHFSADPEGRTMFEREARLHAAVQSDNVVTVYGSGNAEDGEPYLAMELIEGCDAYRLLRRLSQHQKTLPVRIAVHIAREVLRGLASVHSAQDASGVPLGIIHRDVTPSNLYIARTGTVKLGDFGIARSANRQTLKKNEAAKLKGKFAYLAPEQVAGEPFDHRADLFSMATVLSEMILGQPLFPGSGQLAVLLAIRDTRIDPLRSAKDKLPKGLFEVLERALARDPRERFQHAAAFAAELKEFDPKPEASREELGRIVTWVQTAPTSEQMARVRESARAMRAARTGEPAKAGTRGGSGGIPPETEDGSENDPHDRKTGDYPQLPSFVLTGDGLKLGPWTFARLVEAIATSAIGRGDQVDYMGRGFQRLENIEDLARFLPAGSTATVDVPGPGHPDFSANLAETSMLEVLLRIFAERGSGALFAERATDEHGEGGRKDLYFHGGRLHHVASSNASELLGEYLVRRGKLAREELDMALAVLPRYGGRMGDTLISLGLVDAVDVFRAIREQGRDRVGDLFLWKRGKVAFYKGAEERHVEFPLDLDLPTLMLAGLEVASPNDAPLDALFPRLEHPIGAAEPPAGLDGVVWPKVVQKSLEACSPPRRLRDVMGAAVRASQASAADVARAIHVLLAAKLVRWVV
jgi:eukaryotic-like serine/threonine-protein kinase